MKYIFYLFIFSTITINVEAQLRLDTLGWRSPVDIPILLSGNFAELRSNHFHGGIDIKTQSEEGHKIYAVQDGYISRIKVSSGGYGKAIYIVHPDGYTSVYAHLKEFNIQIDRYVRGFQYKRESFAVDLYPTRGELSVEKGDIIALSGNSGSSAGPHLHFEVRETRNSHPMNGLFLGYDVVDTIAPKMYNLYAYPQNEQSAVYGFNESKSFPLKKDAQKYKLKHGDTLQAMGSIGFGLKVNDYLNGTPNRCGVYYLKMYVDNKLYFHSQFDEFSFGETRYINSLMDYEQNVNIKRKLHKLFVDPNNKLSTIYKKSENNGIIAIQEKDFHKVEIEAMDANGNYSELKFYVQAHHYQLKEKEKDVLVMLKYDESFAFDSAGLTINMPKNSFYNNVDFTFHVDTTRLPGTFSNAYQVGHRSIPIHKRYQLAITCDEVDSALQNKLIIAERYKGKYYAVGGMIQDGQIKHKIRVFGEYVVVIDTIPPRITPLGDMDKTNSLADVNRLDFKIEDEFSGIKHMRGTINNQWVLFEWDGKNDHLFYLFDEYMPDSGIAEVEIKAIDKRGNETIFKHSYEVNPAMDNYIGQ